MSIPLDTAVYDSADARAIVALALAEDLRGSGDLTVRAVVPPLARLAGAVIAKQAGVVCGLPVFARVFAALGGGVAIDWQLPDGAAVRPGDVVLRLRGEAGAILAGERTALNIAQRLSGSATLARRFVDAVAGMRARILDTRKTDPGLRLLQKHAVRAGGAHNHRVGLHDQVLIKDNHIALMLAGGPNARESARESAPAEAVRRARAALGEAVVVEVEIERLEDLAPAIAAGADIVLCDNMGPELLAQAVRERDRLAAAAPAGARRVEIEASGGITLATVRAAAATGVDRISVGALTHSAGALDLSLRCAPG